MTPQLWIFVGLNVTSLTLLIISLIVLIREIRRK